MPETHDDETPDEDIAELARMEAAEAREAAKARSRAARLDARWGIAPEDQPFLDEPRPPPEYKGFRETRTAASTGARLPLAIALAVSLGPLAVPPLAGLAARAGKPGPFEALAALVSPSLWQRLEPLRAAPFESILIGALPPAFCITGLILVGTRLRIAAQMLFGAAVVTAADWFLFSGLKAPGVLTTGEMTAAMAFVAAEFLAAGLIWLMVAPPSDAVSPLPGRRN